MALLFLSALVAGNLFQPSYSQCNQHSRQHRPAQFFSYIHAYCRASTLRKGRAPFQAAFECQAVLGILFKALLFSGVPQAVLMLSSTLVLTLDLFCETLPFLLTPLVYITSENEAIAVAITMYEGDHMGTDRSRVLATSSCSHPAEVVAPKHFT